MANVAACYRLRVIRRSIQAMAAPSPPTKAAPALLNGVGTTGIGGGVRKGVSVGVRVGVRVRVCVGVWVTVGVSDGVRVFVGVELGDEVAVEVGVCVTEGDRVALAVGDWVGVEVTDGVGEGGSVLVGVAVKLGVGVVVGVGEFVGVLVGVGVGPTWIVAPLVEQGMAPPLASSKPHALTTGPPQLVDANDTEARPLASPWKVTSNSPRFVPDSGLEHANVRHTEPSKAKFVPEKHPLGRVVTAVTLRSAAGYTIPKE